MFTDSHCHLFNEYYEDMELIIKSAKEHKVDKYINNATNIASCLEVNKLIENITKYVQNFSVTHTLLEI